LVTNPDRPVALVTGAARRIGRAIAEDLAAHGFAVAIHYNTSHGEAVRLADSIAATGARTAIVDGDLADPQVATRIVEKAAKALGPLTLLVNNASIFEKDSIGSLDHTLWVRQMTVNLAAPVFLTEAFAHQVPDDIEGNVVNLIDQRIWRPTPATFSYQPPNSAFAVATEMLALALAPKVRVNGIAPGPVLPSEHQSPEAFEKMTHALPVGHPLALADFGRAVRFLVETRSITGQIIALDGGQHFGTPAR
jgi:NAD(P)-dependent dehydrogenase (short-subunit alcohol dehydrogenase family)